jgi:hypothetical protein
VSYKSKKRVICCSPNGCRFNLVIAPRRLSKSRHALEALATSKHQNRFQLEQYQYLTKSRLPMQTIYFSNANFRLVPLKLGEWSLESMS